MSLPYFHDGSQTISRLLESLVIRVAHRADSWHWSLCCGIKNQVAPRRRKGLVYSIPCSECLKGYIGELSENLEVRLEGHDRWIQKGDQTQSAVAENVCAEGNNIGWDGVWAQGHDNGWDGGSAQGHDIDWDGVCA